MARGTEINPVLIIDTREKEPYSFSSVFKRKKLEAGDYSLEGYESKIALERKSLEDLVHTVIWSRDRFHNELSILAGYEASAIVVEGALRDIIDRKYNTKAHPNAIVGTILSIIVDYGIPVYFCSDRQAACHFVERLLTRYHRRYLQCQIDQQNNLQKCEDV